MNESQSIYELIGEDQIRQLTSHFYKEVAENKALSALYPEDLASAENRLFLFLLQVFGGPSTYSEQRGHPRLRMRHLKWQIDGKMRDHWMNAMLKALDNLKLDTNIKEAMLSYFVKAANHMVNQP
ncbi:cyanoglobin [Algoriphagus halophytocola]|uniref:Cyanoglobin n=1 Tax=Algoriphagus halophytocola TaxID=2991499 RepID=A0ABY6MLZ4_9BACT|nr:MULTISPECIES: cyanoglobin [unclassified Algoriphagus]UZD23701.1 cyanoglobin [Algoriphagus sp. TR-M5]WBL44994.1 cyanoglobin [Algoriphagus sp. TR-M9]